MEQATAMTTQELRPWALRRMKTPVMGHRHGCWFVALAILAILPCAKSSPDVKPVASPQPMNPAPARDGDAPSPQWQPVPLVPQAVLDAGIRPGGEGGQWPQAICIDPVDGEFLLYGTDVGGIFRSLDGGKTFEPCNQGYTPRGNCGFAIDPVNINRALAIGANSLEMDCHGIYLTTDQGASWTHVLPKKTKGYRDFREQVTFDRSSYDAGAACCKVAYWSASASSADSTGRLYKSADGGKTWAEVANSQSLGGGIIKVHPARGYVYVANGAGLFKSMDGGRSFSQKVQGGVSGLDVVAAQPDRVFACKGNTILVSRDAGETFMSVTPGGLPAKRNLLQIRVSPANVSRMVIENNEGDYQWQKYYSADGGKTWALARHDNSLAILPFNPRQPMFAMHPKDEEVAWSFGADWITRTADGGATWTWANNGNNGIMVGGLFNFNVQDPDLLYLAARDYNGALTTDGGLTWTYINMSQIHWGGSLSAGYAATPQILYGAMDNRMRMTRNGGRTVMEVGGVSGARVSYGAPTDPNILFCCNLRSTDQGQHWAPMNGCDGVFTSSFVGGRELYGRNGGSLVTSADTGATWTILASLPGRIDDVAYDHVRNRVYAAYNGELFQYDAGVLREITAAIPADQFGSRRIRTVAVDPVDPSVVYAGGASNVYSSDTAVVRSTDAGQTWQSLIRGVRVDTVKTGPDGGREAIAIRVHPKTRYAYVGTGCYGFWKFGPPGADLGVGQTTAAFNPSKSYGTVTDIDGNVYQTITIGTQTWMAENLRTTKYRNGGPIPEVTDTTAWIKVNTGAYCNYDNTRDTNAITTYGRLYNWYAVFDNRKLCPPGWHVSTDTEWETLTDYLGGASVAGDKLKEAGTAHWDGPNAGTTNEAGFTALPGGHLYPGEPFRYLTMSGNWWSVAGNNADGDWYRSIKCNAIGLCRYHSGKTGGFSVRCVKD
jgi:uncharacterized protein (TIGR02145 family)